MTASRAGWSVMAIAVASLAAHPAWAADAPARQAAAGPAPAPSRLGFDPADPSIRARARQLASLPPTRPNPSRHPAEDPSGRRQVGDASVYATTLEGRRMADQRRFHGAGQAAASKTLPIGTVAKLTNMRTGRSATVTVEDRGPFVAGRAVDVSKATARQLGLTRKEGVAPVIVAPIAVPQPDGTIRPGAGAAAGPGTADSPPTDRPPATRDPRPAHAG